MKTFTTTLLSIFFTGVLIQAQELTQTISGSIVEYETETPIAFANVIIKDSSPLKGTISDENGFFTLENVSIGRITIEVSFMGYETLIIPEVVITSAKEVQLEIKLTPTFSSLDEIVLSPKTSKQKPVNAIASVSARMLSVEEASRYAGGFDDPARLASTFAGVASGNGGDNAIVIRGNAPKFLQWKIEGIEIPNPNHFANLSSFGGGGLTALSSNVLANSDFMTGAFASEYNNALAGVFDIKMRKGNASSYEHSVEAGLIGIDVASEGPINRENNSSYLVNYRYSTLALIPSLLPEEANGTKYQDLSFKLNFPTKNHGIFSLWGIGLLDASGTNAKKKIDDRIYFQDIEDQEVKQYMGSLGLNHKYYFENAAYINSTFAVSTEGIDMHTDRLNGEAVMMPENRINNSNVNWTFKSFYNKRFSARLSNRTGVLFRNLGYDLTIDQADEQQGLENITKENDQTYLMSAYTNFKLTKNNFKFNLGINTQLFSLNNNYTVEPRLGATYQLNHKSSLSLGYGLHSRLEPLQVYFSGVSTLGLPHENKSLDFTKAHHIVLGYDFNFSNKLHLKIEPYYQSLFDVPIVENSNESLLNLQSDWFLTDNYVNKGKGRNYGIDVTFEQYMENGFYYLFTGSLFNSEYKTENSAWFDTRFNKNFLVNALVGKEIQLGKRKQNTLGINVRLSVQGGDRFSKIDAFASSAEKDVVYDETIPFSEQNKASTVIHTTFNYTSNRKKTSHRIALKILNANNYKGFQGHRYNLQTGKVNKHREALMIPNLSYKVSF